MGVLMAFDGTPAQDFGWPVAMTGDQRMEKRHIAVFTPLVRGHVYPALGLCSELVNRGHLVAYPTDERFAAKVRKYARQVQRQSSSRSLRLGTQRR